MTAVLSTRCRRCGAELTDRFSRKLGYGPECRKDLTPDQLADAIRRHQPGYVPKAKPPSTQAVRTNAEARKVATPTAKSDLCPCGSGSIVGCCPPCARIEREPMKVLAEGVDRIIERVRAERAAVRDARYEAWLAAHPPEPQQLALDAPDCHPLREEAS